MARKQKSSAQILALISEVESLRQTEDLTIAEACEKVGLSMQTYYRWKKEKRAVSMRMENAVELIKHEPAEGEETTPDAKEFVQVERSYWEYINDRLYRVMLELDYLKSQIK